MTHRFSLSFESWDDFVDFIQEYEGLLDELSDEENFAYRVQEHARANGQYPEYIEFTKDQYQEIASRKPKSMAELQSDKRCSHVTNEDSE